MTDEANPKPVSSMAQALLTRGFNDPLRYFIYDKGTHKVHPAANATEWAQWLESGDRRIADTRAWYGRVSTVFIGLEHEWFETMVFGGKHDQFQERTYSYEAAMMTHAMAVRMVKPWYVRFIEWWLE